MAEIIVTVTGTEKVSAGLEQLTPIFQSALKAGAEYIKGKVATYPPERHGPMIWSQDKEKRKRQIRGFFAKLRKGEIEVPYRRGQSPGSQSLGRRWTIQLLPDGLTAHIGNNASYGPFVQDRLSQARYHTLTGWTTVQDVEERESENVRKLINDAIAKELKKRGYTK